MDAPNPFQYKAGLSLSYLSPTKGHLAGGVNLDVYGSGIRSMRGSAIERYFCSYNWNFAGET